MTYLDDNGKEWMDFGYFLRGWHNFLFILITTNLQMYRF